MIVRAGVATDVGLVRDHNEDAALVEYPVYLVADGMGGHAAGEVASGIAVETMRALAGRDDLTSGELVEQVRLSNEQILRSAGEHPERAGMGTTATGVAVVRDDGVDALAVLNIGDSRVYRRHEGRLEQVTRDHSEVQELVDAGLLSPQEAARHPLRNLITRSLGAFPDAEVDVCLLEPAAGDRYVICSDGLSNEVGGDALAEILDAHEDPQGAADALVRAALDAGGHDNVTVVVLAVEAD